MLGLQASKFVIAEAAALPDLPRFKWGSSPERFWPAPDEGDKMKIKMMFGAMLVAASVPAAAMSVDTFLTKANALKKKGPLAMFSGDLKLLMNEVKSDSAELRAQNKALAAAGRRKLYCVPPNGANLTQTDILSAMQSVPPAKRAATDTKDALRAHLARRYPCPA